MKKKRIFTIDDITKCASKEMIKLNPGLFGASYNKTEECKDGKSHSTQEPGKPCVKASNPPTEKNRLGTLNKTEARFHDSFLKGIEGRTVLPQPPRMFELEGGGTYTPDFIVIGCDGVDVIEIKGGYRGPGWEQGIERYRRVASLYDSPCLRFKMATWDTKKQSWNVSEWKKRDKDPMKEWTIKTKGTEK